MNAIPRYMKELANAQQKNYINNELIQDRFKSAAAEAINDILRNTEYGLITINEGMKALCNPLDGFCKKGGV